MATDTVPDSTDPGTRRPKENPLLKEGNQFDPLKIEDRSFKIVLPARANPDNPIDLFTLYYTP